MSAIADRVIMVTDGCEGREKTCRQIILDLLDIVRTDLIPPFSAVNELFLFGFYGVGLSEDYRWNGFEILPEEYSGLRAFLLANGFRESTCFRDVTNFTSWYLFVSCNEDSDMAESLYATALKMNILRRNLETAKVHGHDMSEIERLENEFRKARFDYADMSKSVRGGASGA